MNNGNIPEWYWKNGLHDAVIISFEYNELEYDYSSRNPDRSFLYLSLDSRNAMFDTGIIGLRFFNAKFSDDVMNCSGFWWVRDSITCNNGKYRLLIEVMSKDKSGTIEIIFDRAEVIRH